MVRGARVRGGGDPACPGRAGLGAAARLLADHWPGLHLAGRTATVHALLTGFPAEARASDAELAALTAVDELAHGSLEAAERYLGLAERGLEGVFGSAPVPAGRRGQALVLLVVVRLLVARQHGNPPAVAEEARRLRPWPRPWTRRSMT